MCGYEWEAGHMREQCALAEDRDDHGIRDHAREYRRNQRFGFEAVLVQHFYRQQRGAERATKNRRHTRRHAGHHQRASFPRGGTKPAPHQAAERASDLHGWALATARPTGAEREHRRQRLDPDHASPDEASSMVERLDHGVSPAAAYLGRET